MCVGTPNGLVSSLWTATFCGGRGGGPSEAVLKMIRKGGSAENCSHSDSSLSQLFSCFPVRRKVLSAALLHLQADIDPGCFNPATAIALFSLLSYRGGSVGVAGMNVISNNQAL